MPLHLQEDLPSVSCRSAGTPCHSRRARRILTLSQPMVWVNGTWQTLSWTSLELAVERKSLCSSAGRGHPGCCAQFLGGSMRVRVVFTCSATSVTNFKCGQCRVYRMVRKLIQSSAFAHSLGVQFLWVQFEFLSETRRPENVAGLWGYPPFPPATERRAVVSPVKTPCSPTHCDSSQLL